MNEGCGHFEKTGKFFVADEEVPPAGNCPCGHALAPFRLGDLQPDDLGRGFDANVRAVLDVYKRQILPMFLCIRECGLEKF